MKKLEIPTRFDVPEPTAKLTGSLPPCMVDFVAYLTHLGHKYDLTHLLPHHHCWDGCLVLGRYLHVYGDVLFMAGANLEG